MRCAIALMLLLHASLSLSQGQMEIIPLKHRMAEDIVPLLKPLLAPGGTLTGMNNRLIVRTSDANLEQIRQALAAIDTPPRRLMISLKQDNDRAAESAAGGASGEVRRGDDVIRGSAFSTRGRAEDRVTQQVQTVEGRQAFIQVGYSFPLPLHEMVVGPYGAVASSSVVYRDLSTGFYARPNVIGDRVTIEISPQQESLSSTTHGAVQSQRLSTTVSGRLGEWIELGGTTGAEQSETSGIARFSTRGTLEQRRVLLKVEELR